MMIPRRVLSSAARCSNCQFNVLNAFATLSGLSLRPTPKSTKLVEAPPTPSRQLSTRFALHSNALGVIDGEEELEEAMIHEELPKGDKEAEDYSTPSDESSVPWYLQIDPPRPISSALAERQRLPELPKDPPVLLQPILEHISIDQGLDDIKILDLRELDPPPALGGNLLMLIGTGRSEKHVCNSASRFCRWLRTNHKITPYADGLLGRDERKLKMKRKLRRARRMGSVGSAESGNVDDGITTGWVCVNVGVVEEGGGNVQEIGRIHDFVGFGTRFEGVKIVVQMLTETKREELDLEGLWGGTLARQRRGEARDTEQLQQTLSEEEPKIPNMISSVEDRSFDTRSRDRSVEVPCQENVSPDGISTSDVEPRLGTPEAVLDSQDKKLQPNKISLQSTRMLTLQMCLNYLKSLPEADAIRAVGDNMKDFTSTAFLVAFYHNYPKFPLIKHWRCRLELVFYAGLTLRHPGYTKQNILRLFNEMEYSYIHYSAPVFYMVSVLVSGNQLSGSAKATAEPMSPSTAYIDMALEVLEDFSLRGPVVLSDGEKKVFYMVHLAIARAQAPGHARRVTFLRKDFYLRLTRVMNIFGVSITSRHRHYSVLEAYAQAEDWNNYWRYWRGIAREGQHRGTLLYDSMFRAIAASGHQARCVEALQIQIPRMEREKPIVKLERSIAEAVMNCIQVAEPNIEREAEQCTNETGEYVRLWRRCRRGLHATRVVEEDMASE